MDSVHQRAVFIEIESRIVSFEVHAPVRMADSERYIGGEVAVNIDGGLKAKGRPIGATDVSMAYEIVTQPRKWQ